MARRNSKVKGRSDHRTDKGVLYLKDKATYVKVPFRLLRSQDFTDLEPVAMKIYWLIVRLWSPLVPDEPVQISYEKLRQHLKRHKVDRKGRGKVTHSSYSEISKGIGQLERHGFIHKDTRHKKCNRYWIEQRWFTGEFK